MFETSTIFNDLCTLCLWTPCMDFNWYLGTFLLRLASLKTLPYFSDMNSSVSLDVHSQTSVYWIGSHSIVKENNWLDQLKLLVFLNSSFQHGYFSLNYNTRFLIRIFLNYLVLYKWYPVGHRNTFIQNFAILNTLYLGLNLTPDF